MLRRLTPFFTTFLAVLLDTAVLPVIYRGTYTVPITVVVVLCVGLLLGRLRGMLYGMIGGLLMDISTGTLGIMTFFCMAVGFLIGLIIDEASDRRYSDIRFHLRRGGVAFGLYALGEAVFCFYSYFLTASFNWLFVLQIAARSLTVAVLTMLLCPALNLLFYGKKRAQRRLSGNKREVKHF